MKAKTRGVNGAAAIHVFVYGTLRPGGDADALFRDCEVVGTGEVTGMLFDAGSYPALVLAGRDRVWGVIWRCPPGALARLDEYEGVGTGLFRRVGVEVDGLPCWTYVAGPAIVRELRPERRIEAGVWPASAAAE